jgi:hypothetical protein
MFKLTELPTQEYLHECFDYDGASGIVRWKIRPAHHFKSKSSCMMVNTRNGGDVVGYKIKSGHLVVRLSGKNALLHRVVWKIWYGNDPDNLIDHADGNQANNKIENLRISTHSQNCHNQKLGKNNTSGFTGVWFNKQINKYAAEIMFHRKKISIGYFKTAEEASEARVKKSIELFGEFSPSFKAKSPFY